MQVRQTALEGVVVITPKRHGDSRGYFVETYNAQAFAAAGIEAVFVQDNQSLSARRGTIRGLHFQRPPSPQAKLVRVLQGAVFDVAVDIRAGSPTFGRWVGETLTAEAGEQLFVPRGFAHGFCTLTDDAIIAYKVDGLFDAACDAGVHWADPDIGVRWPVEPAEAVLSDKDRALPRLVEIGAPFRHGG